MGGKSESDASSASNGTNVPREQQVGVHLDSEQDLPIPQPPRPFTFQSGRFVGWMWG